MPVDHCCPMCGDRCGCPNTDGPGVECAHWCLPYAAKRGYQQGVVTMKRCAICGSVYSPFASVWDTDNRRARLRVLNNLIAGKLGPNR